MKDKIGREILYLSRQDCMNTKVTEQEIIDATRKAMIAYSTNKAEMPAKIGLHPQPGSMMHAMPAYLPEEYACGIKWGCNFPSNNDRFPSLPATSGQIIFNDPATGLAMSIMDATWITEMRTPATALVSIDCGANPGAKTLGMLGCENMYPYPQAIVKMADGYLKELEEIYIYDFSETAMNKLLEVCQSEIETKIIKCDSCEAMVKQSEMIITGLPIAEKPNPPIKNEWVQNGQTLICLDCHSAFEDAVYKRADRYFVDSVEQHELLAKYGYYPLGLPKITGETGSVAAGMFPGRKAAGELVVFNNVGMATEDIMCAKIVFEKALKKGIGIKLPLWENTTDIRM